MPFPEFAGKRCVRWDLHFGGKRNDITDDAIKIEHDLIERATIAAFACPAAFEQLYKRFCRAISVAHTRACVRNTWNSNFRDFFGNCRTSLLLHNCFNELVDLAVIREERFACIHARLISMRVEAQRVLPVRISHSVSANA